MKAEALPEGGGLHRLRIDGEGRVCKILKKEYDTPLLRQLLEEEHRSLHLLRMHGFHAPEPYAYEESGALCRIVMERLDAAPDRDRYRAERPQLLARLCATGADSATPALRKEYFANTRKRWEHACAVCPPLRTMGCARIEEAVDGPLVPSLVLDDWNFENFLFDRNGTLYLLDQRVTVGDHLDNLAGILVADGEAAPPEEGTRAERARILLYCLLRLSLQYEMKLCLGFDPQKLERRMIPLLSALTSL